MADAIWGVAKYMGRGQRVANFKIADILAKNYKKLQIFEAGRVPKTHPMPGSKSEAFRSAVHR
jgi:hypothetical protein